MAIVLGVDSSTGSTKVEARDLVSGQVVGQATAPHPPTTPPVSEQDPTAWWDALVLACGQLDEQVRSDVVAMSVAGQQHGLVLLDADNKAVRPAKLWNDTESAPQAQQLVDAVGAASWANAVGSVPVAAFTISKLRWVAEHEPAALERATRVMLPHDYLTWRLTGNHVTDRGDASGTGWFDATTNSCNADLLRLAGVDTDSWIDRLPTVLGPTDTAGQLTTSAATSLGLPATVKVGPGTGDNMGAALGLGLQAGDLVVSLGTSGVAYAVSATPTHDASGSVAGFADATGAYLPLVCTLNATKVTDTVARWLGTDAPGLSELALAAETVGPTLVPYFDGERTPNLPNATGTFVGLRNDTTREQLALAAHDGVLCGLLDGVQALADAGVSTSGTLHLIGGGSRSGAYRQRCADLWGKPIAIPHTDETVATGAAVQAAAVHAALTENGPSIVDIGHAWNLGASDHIEPAPNVDAAAIRQRYTQAANR